MNDDPELFAQIPVHFKSGAWVTDKGQKLVATPGTQAVFVVRQKALMDLWPPADELCTRAATQFLGPGARLRFALRVVKRDELTGALLKHLTAPKAMWGQVEWGSARGWQSTDAHFVEVVLGDPTKEQKRKFPEFSGGLLIRARGGYIVDISPSSFVLPEGVSGTKPLSLNPPCVREFVRCSTFPLFVRWAG